MLILTVSIRHKLRYFGVSFAQYPGLLLDPTVTYSAEKLIVFMKLSITKAALNAHIRRQNKVLLVFFPGIFELDENTLHLKLKPAAG